MTTAALKGEVLPRHAETDPDFVYVVFIETTQQKLWDALTDGKSIRPWWADTCFESTFKPGAPLRFVREGKVHVEGQILEAEPTRRLVYTFHVTGPGPQHDEGATLVEYVLEQSGQTVRLTVTHSNLKKGGAVRGAISGGWPRILSSLKSWLERGEGVAFPDWGKK